MTKNKIENKKLSKQAASLEARRTERGPEPERLKIEGVANWEDAVGIAMQKKKPAGGWPK
jgi:hypothetical protein